MRTNLRRRDLNEKIIEAIEQCGWSIIYVSTLNASPLQIRIYNGVNTYSLSLYMWSLTHGGGPRNPNEYRIQVHVSRFLSTPGFQTLILGWWEPGRVFAGFDFTKHNGPLGNSSSIQIGLPALHEASINGLAAHDKGNSEIAIAFRADYFITYVSSVAELHAFGPTAQDVALLNAALNPQVLVNPAMLVSATQQRQVVARTINQKAPAAGFQDRILTAYGHRCAFCDVQLNLIDAAHIVPVSENGSDETMNGIALCGLHHRAYDRALITMDVQYQVQISSTRKTYLTQIGHHGGMTKFQSDLRAVINVPPTPSDRPHPKYIKNSNQMRGWS
jgi:putative restriction endonuclease